MSRKQWLNKDVRERATATTENREIWGRTSHTTYLLLTTRHGPGDTMHG